MVFVTLGTQDKSFKRLLEEIDNLIDKKIIKEKVIVQSGYTKYHSNNMEIFDLLPPDKFNEYIKKSDIIITHGGVGNIIGALMQNKKVIAVPRLARYKEHINDHQCQIVNKFNDLGYIIGIQDVSLLQNAFKKINKFKPNKFISNNSKMLELVSTLIDK